MAEHWDQFQELTDPYRTLDDWLKEDTCTFDAKVRLSGPTVLEPWKSYCLYKAAGVTTPYIIHNLYEMLAYMAHPLHGLNQICVSTRVHPYPRGFKMIPLPWEEVRIAVFRTRVGERPLAIAIDGKNYHTGIEGRAWWSR